MAVTLKADAAGEVKIPAAVCHAVGIEPGRELDVDTTGGRIVLSPPKQSLGERLAARARALPPDALDSLPDDIASQHDHYLYGTPKRPE